MRLHLLVTAIIVVLPSLAHAQGMIAGRVTDENGRVLPGVTVTITAEAERTRRNLVTNRSGEYALGALLPGPYTVEFTLPGFWSQMQRVNVTAGDAAAVHTEMRVAAGEETVVVPPWPRLPGRQGAARACLHGPEESRAEAERRTEALAAMRLIYVAVDREMATRPLLLPRWQELPQSAAVEALRRAPGSAGELARRIQWGSSEPLPGWGIAYVASVAEVRFALTDLTDPCGFTYSSLDPEVIPRGVRLLPLT